MSESKTPQEVRTVDAKPVTQEEYEAMSAEDRCVHLAAALLSMVSVSEYADGGYIAVGKIDGVPWKIEVSEEDSAGTAEALVKATLENTALRQSAEAIGEAAETIHKINEVLGSTLRSLVTMIHEVSEVPEVRMAADSARGILESLGALGVRAAEGGE